MSGPVSDEVPIVMGKDAEGSWGVWLEGQRVATGRNRNHCMAKAAAVLLATSLGLSQQTASKLAGEPQEEG